MEEAPFFSDDLPPHIKKNYLEFRRQSSKGTVLSKYHRKFLSCTLRLARFVFKINKKNKEKLKPGQIIFCL